MRLSKLGLRTIAFRGSGLCTLLLVSVSFSLFHLVTDRVTGGTFYLGKVRSCDLSSLAQTALVSSCTYSHRWTVEGKWSYKDNELKKLVTNFDGLCSTKPAFC